MSFVNAESAVANSDELSGHWAEQTLRSWISEGLLQGYEDGTYKPDNAITRAQFVSLMNRVFSITDDTDVLFKDVAASHWAYAQIANAVQNGYVKGYADNSFKPERDVTRQEAAVMVANYLKLKQENTASIHTFHDASSISDWSADAIAALVDQQIMKGLDNGNFAPTASLSRAQAVTLLRQAFAFDNRDIQINESGTYGPDQGIRYIKGNLIISSPDTVVKNMSIAGDLVITEAVGEGDVHLRNVSVKGTTYIHGGGQNSIHIEDSVLLRISVNKQDGSVRVVATGNTAIQYAEILSPVKLEESFVTDSGFGNVELSSSLPEGSEVELIGQYESVSVLSSNIKIKVPSGSISKLDVGPDASNTEINLSKDVEILDLILNAVAKLIGQGSIKHATIHKEAAGSSFINPPTNQTGDGANQSPAPEINYGGNSSGGGNNEQPPNQCITDACKIATINDLKLGEFALYPIDYDRNISDPGFKPDEFAYTIIIPEQFDSDQLIIPLEVELPEKVTAHYSFRQAHEYTSLTFPIIESNKEIVLKLDLLTDYELHLYTDSGDGKHSKLYRIYIQYERSLQNALHLSKYRVTSGNGETSYRYALQGNVFKGIKWTDNYRMEVYESQQSEEALQTCFSSCELIYDFENSKKGSFYVKVFDSESDNASLAEGIYNYNLSDLQALQLHSAIEVKAYNKNELDTVFEDSPSSADSYSHGYNISINISELRNLITEVAYLSIIRNEINEPFLIEAPSIQYDTVKINDHHPIYPRKDTAAVFTVVGRTEINTSTAMYKISDESKRFAHDKRIQIILYDKNFEPLGYYETSLILTENNVVGGYTLTNLLKQD